MQNQFEPLTKKRLEHQQQPFLRRIRRCLGDEIEVRIPGLEPVRPRELSVGHDPVGELDAVAEAGVG